MHYFKGKLYDDDMRFTSIISIVSTILCIIVDVYLWHTWNNTTMFVICILWSLFIIWQVFSGLREHHFVESICECSELSASVIQGNQKFTIDLQKPFFLTKIQFSFYIGKGPHKIYLYALTPIRIDQITDYFVGSDYVEKIYRKGGVLLPIEAETWLKQITNVTTISEYPKSMYFQGIKQK